VSNFSRKLRKKLEKKYGRKDRRNGIPLSYCSMHGPYTRTRLCACYDENGLKSGVTYEDLYLESVSNGEFLGEWEFNYSK
jgi:hypothetical protein